MVLWNEVVSKRVRDIDCCYDKKHLERFSVDGDMPSSLTLKPRTSGQATEAANESAS